MGRPLKIKQSTTVDVGFNSFSSLDQPTVVIPAGMSSSQYLGVVGGANASIATSTYPVVYVNANVAGTSGDAYIITQKGQTKYLVGIDGAIQDEDIVKGNSYKITSLSNTNWQALGAPATANVGDIFTATVNGTGLTTNGTVELVGVCYLVDSDTPAAGEMQVIATTNSAAFNVSKMTNKYVWDYQTPAVKYAANFFDGAAGLIGTAGSGADVATWDNGSGNYALAQVTDYTS
jgi:hypothetical protein